MATIFNPIVDKEKEEQENQQNEPAVDQSTSLTSGSSSGISTPTSSTGAPQTANKPSRSGQFTNIQNILSANRQGSQQLGQNVNEKVNKQVQTGLNQVGKAKEASVENINTLAGEASQQQNAGRQAVQNIFQGGQDIDLAAQETGAKQGLDTQYQQKLQGSQFQNLQGLMGTQQNIKNISDQTRTGAGQQAILQQNFARPSYTKGQSSLDALLLGGNKEGQQGLAKARQTANQFNPALQKAQGEFETQRAQTQQNLDTSLEGLKQDIQQKISQGQDATAETSLFARLKQEADQFNAQQGAQTAKISDQDALTALNNAGYKVKSLSDKITLPGTNIVLTAKELAKNPAFFQEAFQQADMGNINADTLNRLNALNRIGGQTELNASGNLNRDIQRSLSDKGSNAIAATQNALKAAGLGNLDKFDVMGRGVTADKLEALAKDGLGAAGIRGEAGNMLRNMRSMDDKVLAKFLTDSGFGTDAKGAKKLLETIIKDADAYTYAQQPQNMVSRQPGIFGNTPMPYNFSQANPNYREGQTWDSYKNAIDFSKKVAEQQLKYNQQQTAINNILNKYIRSGK